MIRTKSLKLNAALNAVKTITGIVFPLITFPYISRVLSVDSIGAYNFSASVVSYFQLFAALGISTYAIREGIRYRDNLSDMNKFVSEMFSINLLATFLSYCLLFLVLYAVPNMKEYKELILILSCQIIFTTIGVSWLCNIYEDFLYITIRTLAVQIFSLIAMFLFVKDERDLYCYTVIVTLANSVANIFNFSYLRKKYVKFRITFKCNLRKHLKSILIIFMTTLTITLYVNSDITMLGFMKSDYEIGLYSASVKVYTIIKNLFTAIAVVLIPRFSLLIANGKSEEAKDLFSKVFNTITLLVAPAMIGLFSLSDKILTLVAGSSYSDAGTSLAILSFAMLFSLYAYLYTNCILLPNRKEKVVFYASVVSAVVNIGLNLVIIPFWGINGAAITTLIAEGIMCFVAIYEGCKHMKLIGAFALVLDPVLDDPGQML